MNFSLKQELLDWLVEEIAEKEKLLSIIQKSKSSPTRHDDIHFTHGCIAGLRAGLKKFYELHVMEYGE